MGPLELIEKLINEHGSATILREHLGLLKAQHAALEARCRDAQAKQAQLERDLAQCQARADQAEHMLKALQTGAMGTLVCDQCGSLDITRIGGRPHPVMGKVGVREGEFRCNSCSGITYIQITPR